MARQRIAPGNVGDVAVVEEADATDPSRRYRGLARVVDVDGAQFQVRRWRATKAAAREATRRAGMDKLAALASTREAAAKAEHVADLGDLTTTVGDLIAQTMASAEVLALAAGTVANYRSAASAMADDPIAALRPRELDVAGVRSFLTTYANKHGRSSAQMAKAILNRAMDRAVESRAMMVAFNPVSAAKRAIPNTRVRKSNLDHTRTPDKATVVTMLAALRADPYYGIATGPRRKSAHGHAGTAERNPVDLADLMAFTFSTGCRIGEALALRWSDLHLDGPKPIAEITGTVRFISKAAAAEAGLPDHGAIRQEQTKTKGSDRDVSVPDTVAAHLRERAQIMGVDLTDPEHLARPVFPSPQRHDRFRDPNNLTDVFKAALAANGIDYAATHVARKSFITTMADNNVPLSKIADAVGHTRVGQTQSYLARGRQLDSDVREAANRLWDSPESR